MLLQTFIYAIAYMFLFSLGSIVYSVLLINIGKHFDTLKVPLGGIVYVLYSLFILSYFYNAKFYIDDWKYYYNEDQLYIFIFLLSFVIANAPGFFLINRYFLKTLKMYGFFSK